MTPKNVTRLLADLVSIPSVNPMGSKDPKITGEARVAEYIADYLRSLKLDVTLQMVEPHRPNLIAKFMPRRANQTILLAPHTDTVSVANMTIEPFAAKIRGNYLYGRGACDTKGPMAAILWALKEFLANPASRQSKTKIIFAGLMGEESGNDGARFLMKSGLRADFGIAAEPTGLQIVHTHKGALWFRLATKGKTAHGSTPDHGRSAIYKMARVLEFLQGEYSNALVKERDALLGHPTVNVGVIRGGQQINMVADRCEIEIDRRTLPSESHKKILADLRGALAQYGIKVETRIVRDCHPLATPPTHPMIRLLRKSARTAAAPGLSRPTGRGAGVGRLVGAPWFCDAAVFGQYGIPSIAFGPGRIEKAHTADESIELDQLQRGAQIFLDFLGRL